MQVGFYRKPGVVLLASSFILSAVFSISSVYAQIARIELHAFQTQTPTDQEFLTGKKDAKPATISGELRIPRAGTDRLPAVVLLHGSGGLSSLQDNWAREFSTIAVATFIVDSFTGRGVTGTQNDQDQLSRWVMSGDAYRALEVLAKHPRIDPARVVVMGFSRGGGAAHYSALKRFTAMHGPAGGLGFAGYIGLYPTCNRAFIDGLDVADKPIRIFHGAADDYVPVAGCRGYVERLRKAGKDITLTEYPGAHHVFDNPALKNPVKLPQAQTTRGCPLLEEAPDGRIVNSQTKQPFTYAGDPCVERGTTIAYDPQAHAEVVRAMKEFLIVTLQPK
jgi:dienelactone hydrolase